MDLPVCLALSLLWRAYGCRTPAASALAYSRQWHQKIVLLLRVRSQQSALHGSCASAAPAPEQGAGSLPGWALPLSKMHRTSERCTPCSQWALGSPLSFAAQATRWGAQQLVCQEGNCKAWQVSVGGVVRVERVCMWLSWGSVCVHVYARVHVLNITLQWWSFSERLLANLVTPEWEVPSANALCSNLGMKKCRQTFLQCHQ